jgi:hypothetical protein
MEIKNIEYRIERGYTMSVYGSSVEIHKQMLSDIKELIKELDKDINTYDAYSKGFLDAITEYRL